MLDKNQLPECNILSKACPRTYTTPHEYEVLAAFIQEFVSSDCWALTVDDEQIFNAFAPKTFKELVLDDACRKAVAKNSFTTILWAINRSNKNHTICIYMYDNTPYKIQITYNGAKRQYTAVPYLSAEWFAKYGDNPITTTNTTARGR